MVASEGDKLENESSGKLYQAIDELWKLTNKSDNS